MPSFLTKLGFASLFVTFALAQKSGFGEACDQKSNHLDSDTWALVIDCDAQTYCHENGTCAYRGCRKDIYPFGYNDVPYDQLPPLCPHGQFCPDEMDRCMEQAPVRGPCQKDRDDQCQAPPNFRELAGYLNVNGSICLDFTCEWANATIGQDCINDNTRYQAYGDFGDDYAFVISRDNCANGLYCDGPTLKCLRQKAEGSTCDGANKECLSYNCESDGKCGRAADEPIHPPAYSYALVGLGILALIVGVMVTLWFVHRKTRKENQIRLEQYYNEQIAYRQSINAMSNAKNSLLTLPPHERAELVQRKSMMGDDASYVPTLDQHSDMVPPNMRRDSSAAWSEADSEMMLVDQKDKDEITNSASKWRG